LRIVSDAPVLAPMALDSERHGGLRDLSEAVLSGASDLFSVAQAAVAEHPWALATQACYVGLFLICILAAARVLAGPKAPPGMGARDSGEAGQKGGRRHDSTRGQG
jgi:hypothetical protein